MQIRHRFNESVIFEAEATSMAELVRLAVTSNANLFRADLSGADLSGANLSGANLSEANLFRANLSGASLSRADLSEADLSRADLSEADLSRADLSEANLSRADLSEADLSEANLSGGDFLKKIPIPNIHRAVYEAVTVPGHVLDMTDWHTCETTHCRAGWVVTLAGDAGAVLEGLLGTGTAAALIYQASDPSLERIPNWYADNEEAMADIKRLAGVA